MPGVLDGRAVLQAIHNTVPVIVVTAVDDLWETRATLQTGAFDFIAKPFDPDPLAETLRTSGSPPCRVESRLSHDTPKAW
jgi:DNA-binding NtrC family response regulator